MQAKILSSLTIVPLLTTVSLIASSGNVNAAAIRAGDTLNFTADVVVTKDALDFLKETDFSATPGVVGDFRVGSSTGFFQSLKGKVGVIQDLNTSSALPSVFNAPPIFSFLDCSNSVCDAKSFRFDLASIARNDVENADGSANISLFAQGKFIGPDNELFASGLFTTQFTVGQDRTQPTTISGSITGQPVPEPTTTTGLLAAGAIGAVKASRRKKREETPA